MMGLYPLVFLSVFTGGSLAGLILGPIWSLMTYVFVYFNIPKHQWWGDQVPDLRWSLLSAVLLIASCALHPSQIRPVPWKENRPFRFLSYLLVLMVLVSFVSHDPSASLQKAYEFSRYVLIFYLIGAVVGSLREYQMVLYVVIFGLFNISLLARHRFSGARLDGVGLADASDANMLAAVVLLVLPPLVASFFAGGKAQRCALLLAAPFIVDMFAMCRSRGAIVGLAVQGVTAFWLLRRSIGKVRLLSIGFVLLVGIFSFMDDAYLDRVLGTSAQVSEDEMIEASAGRTEVWKYGLEMARDYPLGAGGGAFMELSPTYFSYDKIGRGVRASHNTYLMTLVEEGIFGLLLYLGFAAAIFRALLTARGKVAGSWEGAGGDRKAIMAHTVALAVSLAGFWAAAFFIDRIYFEGFYLMAALVPVMARLAERSSARSEAVSPLAEGSLGRPLAGSP